MHWEIILQNIFYFMTEAAAVVGLVACCYFNSVIAVQAGPFACLVLDGEAPPPGERFCC